MPQAGVLVKQVYRLLLIVEGRFVGVECKAGRSKRPTALQRIRKR